MTWQPIDAIRMTVWGFLLETLLYGIYILLFGLSLFVHHRYLHTRNGHASRKTGRVVLSLAVAIFLLISADWLLACVRLFEAFVVNAQTQFNTLLYLANLSHPKWLASLLIRDVVRILMDGLLVARLSVFWHSKFLVIAIPAATIIGDLVASVMKFYWATRYTDAWSNAFEMESIWITTAYSFSCGTNIIASSLIIWRVILQNRALREFHLRTSLVPVMMVIIESALIYTIFTAVQLALFKSENPAVTVTLAMVMPFTGIVYSLMTIQMGLGLSSIRPPAFISPDVLHRVSALGIRSRRDSLPIANLDPDEPLAMPLHALKHSPSIASDPALPSKPV